ncbi:hypothetical protein HanHA300_Chr04g0151801 [Helianthus annuus]|nr:hypothetical protein HanHA300_Chr04g0151801 [Helianthus annuus]KAJ0598378.1 hypothetical protein HanHA89_Chr04g0165151 [Helianthus annuus]
MWDKKNEGCKPYRASSRTHEPSQAKHELGSFTNRAEPSWLVYNRANFEPSFLRAFFERVSSELRATSFLNTPTPNSNHFYHRGKGLIKVHSFPLIISFGNKPSFIPFSFTCRLIFYFIHPLTTYRFSSYR